MNKKVVFANEWERYEHWAIETPNGKVIDDYGAILYPTDWLTVVVRMISGKFAMVRCHRPVSGYAGWEFPGGRLLADEDEMMATIRRVQEEIGVMPDQINLLGSYYPLANHSNVKCFLTLASNCTGKPEARDSSILDVHLFTKPEIRKLISNGDILEGSTLVAWYHYEQSSLAS